MQNIIRRTLFFLTQTLVQLPAKLESCYCTIFARYGKSCLCSFHQRKESLIREIISTSRNLWSKCIPFGCVKRRILLVSPNLIVLFPLVSHDLLMVLTISILFSKFKENIFISQSERSFSLKFSLCNSHCCKNTRYKNCYKNS